MPALKRFVFLFVLIIGLSCVGANEDTEIYIGNSNSGGLTIGNAEYITGDTSVGIGELIFRLDTTTCFNIRTILKNTDTIIVYDPKIIIIYDTLAWKNITPRMRGAGREKQTERR